MAVSGLGPNSGSVYGSPSKNSNTGLYIALGVGGTVVVAAAYGIYRYSQKNKAAESKNMASERTVGSQDSIALRSAATAAPITYGPDINAANRSAKISATTKTSQGEYRGVTYDIEDPVKIVATKTAIDKALEAGTNLDNLHIISKASEDRNLQAPYGNYTYAERTVRFRHSVDWNRLSEETRRDHPVWRDKMYGGPAHLALHEIGHHAHANSATEAQFDVAHDDFNEKMQESIANELGHPYPAQRPCELIAEMYASKAGAGKTFSPRIEKIYRDYGGPKVKLPLRV